MTRCFELVGSLVALTALAGCMSLAPRLSSRSIVGGYKLMDAPTSDLPIGAEWRQGIGPSGSSTGPDNIVVRRSFSTLSLSRSARRGLEIKLAEYIGLEPNTEAKLSATISEVTIASVRDGTLLPLAVGDMYLADAMKASRITIETGSQVAARLASDLGARGVRVTTEGHTDGVDTLTLDGADLYFAYRVMRLELASDGTRVARVVRHPRAPGW
jgi:hypothetical protein